MDNNASGTIGYAGLSAGMLIPRAKAFFTQPTTPRRFCAFIPLFPAELVQNMEYLGVKHGARVAPNGFSVDPNEYHAKLYAQMPELYAGDNALRNFTYEGRYLGNSVFTVDPIWAETFPQYRPFMGDKLAIHLIGGSGQAVAVPESVDPRGGGVLEAAEEALGIAERGMDYTHYVQERVAEGEPFDAEVFAAEYLTAEGLSPVSFSQNDLARVLQDLAMVKSLQGDDSGAHSYTEYARLAEQVSQYMPMRYACDCFTPEVAEKHATRLAQLCFADNDFISDQWVPFAELNAFVDRRTMTLDARRVCAAFQIAPRYDPETGGGRCPDTVRVATAHDTEVTLMEAQARNNPAYGDGLNAEGGAVTLVFAPDSREMIRQRRMSLERCAFTLDNLTVPPEEYRRMQKLAVLQEQKGRLIDALHRRETALRQMDPSAPVYEKARALLNARVEKVAAAVAREAAALGDVPASGYDEDIAYLRRMEREREGTVRPDDGPFVPDAEREQSIEGGYAMRGRLLKKLYAQAALPQEPVEPLTEGADDSEDGEAEPLPTLRCEAIEGAAGEEPVEAEAVGDADVSGETETSEETDESGETNTSGEAEESDETNASEETDASDETNVSAETDASAEANASVIMEETEKGESDVDPSTENEAQHPPVSLKELSRSLSGDRNDDTEKPALTMAQLLKNRQD